MPLSDRETSYTLAEGKRENTPQSKRMTQKGDEGKSGMGTWWKKILIGVVCAVVIIMIFFLGFIAGWFGRGDNIETPSTENVEEEALSSNITIDGQINVNEEYQDGYADPTSEAFKNFSGVFCSEMESLLQAPDYSYESCTIESLTSGSVIVKYKLRFVTTTKCTDLLLPAIFERLNSSTSPLLNRDTISFQLAETEASSGGCSPLCRAASFQEEDCSSDMDECSADPCENGECVNTEGGYLCNCANSGYKGMSCEDDIDECSAQPCYNGGVCTNVDGSFSCDCTDTGYNDTLCETEIDECSTGPCTNGLCVNTAGSYLCHCADSGYEGDLCEDDIDECLEEPCYNGGVCTNVDGSFNCDCTDTGYNGTVCETAECNYRQLTDCSFNSCKFQVNCDTALFTNTSITEEECVGQACVYSTVNTISYTIDTQQCDMYNCTELLGLQFSGDDIHIYIRQP